MLAELREVAEPLLGQQQRRPQAREVVGQGDDRHIAAHRHTPFRARKSSSSAAISGPLSSCRKCRPVTRCGPSACGISRLNRAAKVAASKTSSSRPQQQGRPARGGEPLLQPFEARPRPGLVVQRDPARPGPGQQPVRRVRQRLLVGGLGAVAEAGAVHDGEVHPAPDQRRVPPQQPGPDQRRVHHAPGEAAGVELRRRRGPGPGAHDRQRRDAVRVGQRAAEARRPAPVMADEGRAAQIEPPHQRDQAGGVVVQVVRVLAARLLR